MSIKGAGPSLQEQLYALQQNQIGISLDKVADGFIDLFRRVSGGRDR